MSKLADLETAELVDRAAAVAREDPAGNTALRWKLLHELQRRAEDDVFRAAAAWCGSREVALRCLGADVLGQLGITVRPYARDSAPLLGALLDDDHPEAIASALIACGHLGVGESAAICMHARHADPGVRLAVAICLGGRESPESLATLAALCGDEDRDVRNWATFGLGSACRSDTPGVRDALAARLAEDDEEIRGEAILGLARRGDRRVTEDAAFVPALEALLADNPGDGDIADALRRCRVAPAPR